MSEENLLDEVIDDIKNEDGKLPQMLNVLTILTFIGSGLNLLAGLLLLVGGGALAAYLPGAGAGASGNLFMIGLVSIISGAACLFGAIKMRKLDKQGFYIYVAGVAIGLVGGIALGGFNIMSIVWAGLFVGLYSTQLKEMK